MTKDELIALLKRYEWRDVEFKEAAKNMPKNVYETVSAFANTEGGHLVFGVKKQGQTVEVVGVLDVDKVQGDFLTALRQPDKISVILDVQEEYHEYEGADLLIFYVPEASRMSKPVYLDGNPQRAFLRKGGSDVRCVKDELNRFLMDAAVERHDGHAIECSIEQAFDIDTIRWYRAAYEGRPGNRSYAQVSDLDFLFQLGLLLDAGGTPKPTRAAILLFGTDGAVRQLLPRPVVDCQRFARTFEDMPTGERWTDRTLIEENLIRTWRRLLDWYQNLAEHPFRIDPVSLQRDDSLPDYIAFREAAINLLIHQDYSDHTRKPEIRVYQDRTVFWNPGDAFASIPDLLEPGQKEVRNPRIVTAFRRIGFSEHAGWGLPEVFRNWQALGRVPPRIVNDKAHKTFELSLLKEVLLSEEQLLLQASLGVHLSEDEARTFAYACRQRVITPSDITAITGQRGAAARQIANRLCTQLLLATDDSGEHYVLAEHLRERFSGQANQHTVLSADDIGRTTQQGHTAGQNLSTEQVGRQTRDLSTEQVQPLTSLSETQWRIVAFRDIPRTLNEIMTKLGMGSRGHFKNRHLDPLIRGGVVRMTNPDKPQASNQRYVLSEVGAQLKAQRLAKKRGTNEK